jgi:DNA-binding transcriptional LysR family regulator
MNEMHVSLLEGLPVLRAVMHTGSATRAAVTLQMSPATVLRKLSAMEDALGAQLFDRHPSGLLPLPALERVAPWVEQAMASLNGMCREVAGLESVPGGEVRLALPAGVAQVLLPFVGRLQAAHPALTLSFVSSAALVDLERREADLALRMVRPESGDLVVQQAVKFRMVVAATPALAASVLDWRDLPWLDWTQEQGHYLESLWLRQVSGARVVLRCSDMVTLLHAASQGLGAVFVAEPLARIIPGLCVVDTGDAVLPEGALWLVAHRSLRSVPRVNAVWTWILDVMRSGEGAGRS